MGSFPIAAKSSILFNNFYLYDTEIDRLTTYISNLNEQLTKVSNFNNRIKSVEFFDILSSSHTKQIISTNYIYTLESDKLITLDTTILDELNYEPNIWNHKIDGLLIMIDFLDHLASILNTDIFISSVYINDNLIDSKNINNFEKWLKPESNIISLGYKINSSKYLSFKKSFKAYKLIINYKE